MNTKVKKMYVISNFSKTLEPKVDMIKYLYY